MRGTLVRVVRHGVPTAAALAVLGYGLAEGAAMWVGARPVPRAGDGARPASPTVTAGGQDLGHALRTRLPVTMAAWGFGLVAVFEVLAGLWRPAKPAAPAAPAPPPEDEAEQLLNQLLQQAEAAEAARAANPKSQAPTPN